MQFLANQNADSLESCFDYSICPGTGSPEDWLRNSFEHSEENGHYWQCQHMAKVFRLCYNYLPNFVLSKLNSINIFSTR